MIRSICVLFALLVCTVIPSSAVLAWDVSYDGGVLPNAADWSSPGGSHGNNLSNTSVTDGVLHLLDQDTTKTAFFYKVMPQATPITLEARVRVVSGTEATTNDAPARIEVGRIDACVFLGLWPDKIKCDGSTFSVDMTSFHVIRIALQADNHYQVWLDGTQVFTGSTTVGSQAGIVFGSSRHPGAAVDSYWDYVNYSKAYVSVQ